MPDGKRLEVRLTGPDLPETVPHTTISPADVPKDPRWRGAYRLAILAPLLTLDLSWTPGEPLRILAFSRGDWEAVLTTMAPPDED